MKRVAIQAIRLLVSLVDRVVAAINFVQAANILIGAISGELLTKFATNHYGIIALLIASAYGLARGLLKGNVLQLVALLVLLHCLFFTANFFYTERKRGWFEAKPVEPTAALMNNVGNAVNKITGVVVNVGGPKDDLASRVKQNYKSLVAATVSIAAAAAGVYFAYATVSFVKEHSGKIVIGCAAAGTCALVNAVYGEKIKEKVRQKVPALSTII